MDDIEKGRGQGPSKQIAKEAAAKQAFINMGWAGYGPYGMCSFRRQGNLNHLTRYVFQYDVLFVRASFFLDLTYPRQSLRRIRRPSQYSFSSPIKPTEGKRLRPTDFEEYRR